MWILDCRPGEIEKTITLEPDANSIAKAVYSYYELREKEILAHAHEIDIDELQEQIENIPTDDRCVGNRYLKAVRGIFSQFLQDKLKQEGKI